MKSEIKYAPQTLDEVIYPSLVVERTIKGYASGRLEGHVMLYGPNGTGKTTVANLLIKAIGGDDAIIEQKECDELMAIKDLKHYLFRAGNLASMTTSKKHFLLFNEFDNYSKRAHKLWTALDYCGDSVMAVFTTNKPMDIDRSLRSRAELVEFGAVSAKLVLPRVQIALRGQGVHLPDPQVLHYLRNVEEHKDIRKYMREADKIILAVEDGLELPPWSGAKSSLKIV